MTLYAWIDLYEQAVTHAKGDRPGIELEGRIVERFEADPERVQQAIQRIGAAYQRGDIHSFWAVLDTDLAAPAGPRFTTTATAKQPSSWKTTAEHWEPELPPAPRKVPDNVREFMQRHWPPPLETRKPVAPPPKPADAAQSVTPPPTRVVVEHARTTDDERQRWNDA